MKKGLLQIFFLISFFAAITAFGARPVMTKSIQSPLQFTGRTGFVYGGGVTIGNGYRDEVYRMDNGGNQMLGFRLEYAVSKDFKAHFDLSGNGSVLLVDGSSYYTDEFIQPFRAGNRSACCSYDYMAGFGGTFYIEPLRMAFSATLGAGQFGFVDGEAVISDLSLGYQLQAVRQIWNARGGSYGIGIIYSKLNPTFSEKKYGDIKGNAEKIGIILTTSAF